MAWYRPPESVGTSLSVRENSPPQNMMEYRLAMANTLYQRALREEDADQAAREAGRELYNLGAMETIPETLAEFEAVVSEGDKVIEHLMAMGVEFPLKRVLNPKEEEAVSLVDWARSLATQ